jgi:hypothetical protein
MNATQPTANSAPLPLVCVMCKQPSTTPLCHRAKCLVAYNAAKEKEPKE